MSKRWFCAIPVLLLLTLTSTALGAYGEAPDLAAAVAEGTLPPVEERLPKEPLVVEPLHGVGEYGGTWYRHGTYTDWNDVRMKMYGFSPVRWVDDGLGIEPNWVQAWSVNEDATVWTLYLREGIKWSDGVPMTAADFMFWWEDMVLNEEMSDPIPDMFVAGGQPAEIHAPDDFTIVIEYAGTEPLLLERMAMWPNAGIGERLIVPKHYLEQFHPDYSDEYDSFEVFEEKMEWWTNVDSPVISEWMPVEHDVADRLVMARNPFYYAVDTEGNQLPYIDEMVTELNEDVEVVKLRWMAGEADMQLRRYVSMTDLSMLIDGEAEGDYAVKLWDSGSGTGPIFYWNWNHPDDEKLELYRMPEFRRAMSHALDRQRMQDMLYFGLGTRTTGTFSPKSVEFHRSERGQELYHEWNEAYLEYNPELAEELLDSIGVVDQNNDGWRQLPSGERLQIRVDYDGGTYEDRIQATEMAKTDWEAIGLEINLNPMDGAALGIQEQRAEFDLRAGWDLGDGPNFLVFPQWVVPIDLSRWAPLYGSWYQVKQAGELGRDDHLAPRDRTPPHEEPAVDDPVRRLQDLYDQARVNPHEEERDQLVFEMIRIHIDDGPFFLGTVKDYPRIVIVKNNFHNVPDSEDLALGGFVNPWIMVYPAITHPAQYWISQE